MSAGIDPELPAIPGPPDAHQAEWRAAVNERLDELGERITEVAVALMGRDEYRDDLLADTVERVDAFERQLGEIAERPDGVALAAALAELRSIRESAQAFYASQRRPVPPP